MTVRKSLAWSFSQESIQKIVRFTGSILVARLLTPEEIGIFAIAMAFTLFLNSLQDFGVGAYLIREKSITVDKIRTVFGISLLIHFFFGSLILVIRHPISEIYSEPRVAEVLAFVALTTFLTPLAQPASALLRREMKFAITHHIAAASVVSGTLTTVSLAALGYSYMSMAWGLLVGTLVRIGFTLIVRRDHLRLLPGFRHWREVVKFGGWLSVASICGTSATEVRKLILGAIANPAAVALFERSEQIPLMARQMIFMPVGRVLLPSFSRDIRAGRSIGPKVRLLISSTTVLIWPAFLVMGFMAVPITTLLFGNHWRSAGEILPYLLVAAALLTLLPQPEQILTPLGRVRQIAIIRASQAFSFIVTGLIGSFFGLELFAKLQIVSYSLLLIAIYAGTYKYLELSLSDLGRIYVKSGSVALCASVPSIIGFMVYYKSVPIGALLFILMSSGLLWILSIIGFRHPIRDEMFYIFELIFKRLRGVF